MLRNVGIFCMGGLVLLAPWPAIAEELSQRQNRLLEEVVVTAQKREESIQDVPISIQAFSGAQMDALGIESTKDLGRITPGLQFTEMAGYTLVYLRGTGTDAFLATADPSVATYIDGLYVPALHGLAVSLGGVERVEVLKGPQGTLFGRNATGGAISVITKSPREEFAVDAELELGELGTRNVQAYVSVPITDTLGVSIAGADQHRDQYYSLVNPVDDYRLPDDDSAGARIKLNWRALDSVEFQLSWFTAETSGAGSTLSSSTYPSELGQLVGVQKDKDYEVSVDRHLLLEVEADIYSMVVDYYGPYFDVKLVYGNQDLLTANAVFDYDATTKPMVSFSSTNLPYDMDTAELQFVSNESTPGWLQWVAGAYYLNSDAGYSPLDLFIGGGESGLLGISAFTPFLESLPLDLSQGLKLKSYGTLHTESSSVFAQASFSYRDWLRLTLGGRYQEEDRVLTQQYLATELQGGDQQALDFHVPGKSFSNFSPKATLDFQFNDQSMIYVSWSKAFKSGTFNSVVVYEAPDYVLPEEVTSYELGLKSDFFDGNLRFNAALFRNDTENVQAMYISLTNGGAITFENAGQAQATGFEFDALITPMPVLNPGLVLTVGGSFINAKYTDYQNGSGYDPDTGLFEQGQDFTDHKVARSPDFTGNIGLVQDIYVESGMFEFGLDIYYNDGFYYTAVNDSKASQGAYSTINARAGYTYMPWGLTLTGYVQNLDDETYSVGHLSHDFTKSYYLAPPRIYGLRLGWEY